MGAYIEGNVKKSFESGSSMQLKASGILLLILLAKITLGSSVMLVRVSQ